MLAELIKCRQIPGEPRRRWFSDRAGDLIVWFDEDQSISGIQLCYDKKGRERAITWIRGKGISHLRVDTGEMYGRSPDALTPILVPDGCLDVESVLRDFHGRASNVDPDIVAFVNSVLRSYTEGEKYSNVTNIDRSEPESNSPDDQNP